MLKRPEAATALKDFVVAALYTDKHTQYREVMDKRFKEIALPLYVVVGPDGKERSRLAGQINLPEFLEFLKKGSNSTGMSAPSLGRALAEARKAGKPVLLQFHSGTTPDGGAMKSPVLGRPAVEDLLRDFVVTELSIDGGERTPENLALMRDRFRSTKAPFYVILNPDGTERSRIEGTTTEAAFIVFLMKGLEPTAMK